LNLSPNYEFCYKVPYTAAWFAGALERQLAVELPDTLEARDVRVDA